MSDANREGGSGQPKEVLEFAQWLAKHGGPGARDDLLGKVKTLASLAAPEENVEEQPPVRTLAQYIQNPPPVPPELVSPKYLVRGGVSVMVARAGKGKTSLALNRILPWAAGRPMFDKLPDAYVPSQPLKTLIIENEGAGGEFYRKITHMLENHAGRFDEEEIAYIWNNTLVWGEGGYAGIKMDNEAHEALIRRAVEQHEPDTILLEPFARLHSGEENSNTEMNHVLSVLESIAKDYGVGIMLAHHEKKGKLDVDDIMDRARGATALEGVVTYMEFFQPVSGGRQREIIPGKKRYGNEPPPPSIRMEWREDWSGWYDYVAPDEQVERTLKILSYDIPKFTPEIAEELEEKDTKNVIRWLRQAKDEGRVVEHPGFSTGGGSSGLGWTLKRPEGDDYDTPEF